MTAHPVFNKKRDNRPDKFCALVQRHPKILLAIVILAYAFRAVCSAPAPPPSQVSPVTGSRHRGTDSRNYSTGCQLQISTWIPLSPRLSKRQHMGK